MADDRRRRFLQIERPRQPGAPPASTAPSGHVDRFRAAAEQPLEVDDRAEASQPFVRCCRCETDNTRYALRCTTCAAELDTDEQRAFNERLWEARRATADEEARTAEVRRAALEESAAEEARARRDMAEAMAREVGERERRRLDAEGFSGPTWGPPSGGGGGWTGGGTGWSETGAGGGLLGGTTPLAFRLLALLPDPRWRVAAGVAAVALPALLYVAAPRAGLGVGLFVAALFLPGGWRRRRW